MVSVADFCMQVYTRKGMLQQGTMQKPALP